MAGDAIGFRECRRVSATCIDASDSVKRWDRRLADESCVLDVAPEHPGQRRCCGQTHQLTYTRQFETHFKLRWNCVQSFSEVKNLVD